MVDNSNYGTLFGFTTGKLFDGIGPVSAQNLLSQTVQRMLVDGDTAEAALAWGQEQRELATEEFDLRGFGLAPLVQTWQTLESINF
jgi:multiple sugar transport system substrate-binding protein